MPKVWNKRERECVRATLINEGGKLFEKYGLRKTTIDEIVKKTGIAKGSFYQFFVSKEMLFLAILEDTEKEFRAHLFKEFDYVDGDLRVFFRNFFNGMIDLLVTMPLYRQLDSVTYTYLLRKLPEEVLHAHIANDQSEMAEFFTTWIQRGMMKAVDVAALNALMFELVSFVFRRDELVSEVFEATKRMWIEMFAAYLVPDNQPDTER